MRSFRDDPSGNCDPLPGPELKKSVCVFVDGMAGEANVLRGNEDEFVLLGLLPDVRRAAIVVVVRSRLEDQKSWSKDLNFAPSGGLGVTTVK